MVRFPTEHVHVSSLYRDLLWGRKKKGNKMFVRRVRTFVRPSEGWRHVTGSNENMFALRTSDSKIYNSPLDTEFDNDHPFGTAQHFFGRCYRRTPTICQ